MLKQVQHDEISGRAVFHGAALPFDRLRARRKTTEKGGRCRQKKRKTEPEPCFSRLASVNQISAHSMTCVMVWPPTFVVWVALPSEHLPFSIVMVVSVTTGSMPGRVCVVVHLQSLLLLQLQRPIIAATAIKNNTFFMLFIIFFSGSCSFPTPSGEPVNPLGRGLVIAASGLLPSAAS